MESMDEYDVLGGYVPSFVQHLKDTRARLGLGMGSQASDGLISVGNTVGEAAHAHAPSSWAPAERDAFFRAVSVHSRWRPDLIATCVPTKTEWEVWMYLEALEEGAATLAMQQGSEDVDGSGDERRNVGMQVDRLSSDSDSSSDMDEDENVCEPALEVSQTWIDAEERMASWIVQEEHLTSVEGDAEDVVDEPRKRKRGRPRGTGRGRAQSRVQARAVAKEGRHSPPRAHRPPSSEPSPTSARRLSREPSTVPAQKREALMSRLEVPHLLVLDGILREGEEVMKEKGKSREGSVTGATLAEHGDEGEPHVRDTGVPSPSDLQVTGNVSESLSNAVIDPVLLALSDPAERQSGRAPSQGTLTSCAPTQGPSSLHHASSQPPSFGLSFLHGATNMFTFPPGNTTYTNPDPTANVESDLSLFSPRSRRRIQKRLYMRRKRASLRENSAASEGVIDTGIKKLRPGKKAKSEWSETPAVSTSVTCSEAPSDGEREVTENVPQKNKGGLTLPYKLKAQFAELGIDAAYLGSEGMDLLNLGAMGKLLGLCTSLEHGEEEEDGSAIVQSIDAQLIRHLQAATVSFVTDILHRAIVWREREIRLKQRSQAWRQGGHITIAAIEHAVAAVGARYHSHKEYFKSLGVSPTPANATEAPDPAKTPFVEAADQSAGLPRLSPHRDVYTPLIRPPSGWRIGALTCLTRTYEREATRTRRGPSADIEEEELMSDETDEETWEAALKDEDEADIWDMQLATTEEQRLWAGVRRK